MQSALSNTVLTAKLTMKLMVRHWMRHWLKLFAVCLVVALGTGMHIAIDIANKATTQSFESFTDTISGPSDFVITSTIGDLTLDDLGQARQLLMDSETTLAPVFETNIQLTNRSDSAGQLLAIGVDFYALTNHLARIESQSQHSHATGSISRIPLLEDAMKAPNAFFCDKATAENNNWLVGDNVSFYANTTKLTLKYFGSYPTPSDQNLSTRAVVMDAKKLTTLLERPLSYDRLELIVSKYDDKNGIQSILETNKPQHWTIETQGERKRTGKSMTQALRMNLRALSTLSLLVAAFLVFQALDSSVVKRHKEIAILHSLGSPRWLSKALWLTESILIGIIGGGLGILLGNFLGKISTGMVSQTVDTLYYFSGDTNTEQSLAAIATTWIFVILSCVIAGWWPAKQASQTPPAQLVKHDNKHSEYSASLFWQLAAGCSVLAIIGYVLPPIVADSGHSIPIGGYLLAISLIGLFVSVAIISLGYLGELTPLLSSFSYNAKIGVSQLRRPVTRHRLALGGVTVAVGMTASMIILISSFESTVRNWIGDVLQADLFIRSKASGSLHSKAKIDPDLFRDLFLDSRITDGSKIYTNRIRLDGHYTKLIGYDYRYTTQYNTLNWIKKPTRIELLLDDKNAIVSESFQERFKKKVGDIATLELRGQTVDFEIIGIYADYGNEQGSIGIANTRYETITGDLSPVGIALHLRQNVNINTFVSELETTHPSLSIVTNKWLREETMRIFNRVFSVTYALEFIGLFISVAGLGSMIFSLMLERSKEIGALRMIGISRINIRRSTAWEACNIAFLGSAFGILLGQCLGLVLIYIINKQSFGWTLQFSQPFLQLATLFLGVIVAAGVIADIVSKWILNQPIDREE